MKVMRKFHRQLTTFIAVAALPIQVWAVSNLNEELLKTPWQFGLVGKARTLPTGLAFQKGITASVLRLLPGGEARIELPCRNEEFLKKVGEDLVFVGTWELRDENLLTYTISFRGQSRTESGVVTIEGDELRLLQANGTVRKAGRFYGNVQDACRYE